MMGAVIAAIVATAIAVPLYFPSDDNRETTQTTTNSSTTSTTTEIPPKEDTLPPELPSENISSEPEENPDSSVGSQNDPLLSIPKYTAETKLSIPPLKNEDYFVIVPLGNIGPPGHTIPTDHIYYFITKDDDKGMVIANIYAPGDIRILELSYVKYFTDGVLQFIDYNIAFASCRDQILVFGHVGTINTELRELLNNTEIWCWERYGIEPETMQQCEIKIALDVEAGTILGTAGNFSFGKTALDVWAWDFNSPPLQYANPLRYRQSSEYDPLHIVCPLDLFTDEAKKEQESKLGDFSGNKRTIEPICGEVMQDIPGTAHGNWFAGEDLTDMSHWDQHLAFVHDNFNPTFSVISIAGTVMDPGFWLFTAENNGTINRKFSDVTPDGKIYCYDAAVNHNTNNVFPGFLIIQLLTPTEMLVEHGSGTCEPNIDFVNPTTYHR